MQTNWINWQNAFIILCNFSRRCFSRSYLLNSSNKSSIRSDKDISETEMNDAKNRRTRTLSTRSRSVKREWQRVGRQGENLSFQYRSDEFLSQWKWTVSLKVYTSITREKTEKSDDEGVATSFEKNITLRFLSLRKTILWSTRRRQGKQEEKKEMKEEK